MTDCVAGPEFVSPPRIDPPLVERLRGRYGKNGGPYLPTGIMLEAADHIENMERELAMVKADRDHLLACAERARASRSEDAGELEVAIRSASFNSEQCAIICKERDDALQHAKQESEAHAHTRHMRDVAERMLAEARANLNAMNDKLDQSIATRNEDRDAIVRLVGERDRAREEVVQQTGKLTMAASHLVAAQEAANAETERADHAERVIANARTQHAGELAVLRAALANAELRANEANGKAGVWISIDEHRAKVLELNHELETMKAMRNRLHVEVLRAFSESGKLRDCTGCGAKPGTPHAVTCMGDRR